MSGFSLLLVCTLAWLAWIPAVLLQKMARGDGGWTSVLPAIPLLPVGGWLAGVGPDRLFPGVMLDLIGGGHLALTIVFVASALISAAKIRRGGRDWRCW